MACTVKLKTTIDITQRYIYNAPLLYVNSGDLAYSIGDWVRQLILSPPFVWRWNRGFIPPIVCIPGTYDYQVNVPDFGFIEKATLLLPVVPGNTNQYSKELTIEQALVGETILGLPAYISTVADDNNGNITFRLMGNPDQPYVLNIIYQKASPNFGSVTDTWAPIPDYLSYLYNLGYLAKTYEYKGDERFAFAHQEFLKQLVAASDGLTDTQKNIFLDQRLTYTREIQGASLTGQIAKTGRSGA
jgi:hypothetical protein